MKLHIGMFKTTQTLYLDRDEGYWDIDKPVDFDKNDDVFLRKGSVLQAYHLEDINHSGYKIILEHANGSWLEFTTINDLYKYPYIYQVYSSI